MGWLFYFFTPIHPPTSTKLNSLNIFEADWVNIITSGMYIKSKCKSLSNAIANLCFSNKLCYVSCVWTSSVISGWIPDGNKQNKKKHPTLLTDEKYCDAVSPKIVSFIPVIGVQHIIKWIFQRSLVTASLNSCLNKQHEWVGIIHVIFRIDFQ